MSNDIRIFPYLYEYFKFNKYTVYLILFYLILFLSVFFYVNFLNEKIRIRLKKIFSSKNILIFSIILTIVLHGYWILLSPYQTKTTWCNSATDFDLIHLHANDLTRGVWFQNIDGSPSGRRPIGYPIFLGLWYSIFGSKPIVALILQIILSTITTFLIYYLGKYAFSEPIGALSSFLFSWYPISVFTSKLITDEHLFLVVLYFGLMLLLRETSNRIQRKWSWLVYGVVFGYAAMIRTHAIIMPLVVAVTYLSIGYSKKKIFINFIAIIAVMQLINLPWVIRNYKAWKVPVIYTATGHFVYGQLNSAARGFGGGHIPIRGEEGYSEELEEACMSGNEGICHQVANKVMTKWCIDHPLQFMILGTEKVLEFMGVNHRGVWPLWFEYAEGSFDQKRALSSHARFILEHFAYGAYYILFFSFILSVVVFTISFKKMPHSSKAAVTALLATICFYLAEHFFIYADRKYRYPLEPIMLIFAAAFIYRILYKFKCKLFTIKRGEE